MIFATSICGRYTSAPVTGKAPSIGNAIGSGVADTVSAAYDGVVSTAQTAYSGSLNTAKQSACGQQQRRVCTELAKTILRP